MRIRKQTRTRGGGERVQATRRRARRPVVTALVTAAAGIVLFAAMEASSSPESEVRVGASHGPSVGDTTADAVPVDRDLGRNLSCQGEMMGGTSYDSLAGNGFATPDEALEETLSEDFPQAPRTFKLTGRNHGLARFENDRGAFLVGLLGDGLWHMDQSTVCASTATHWTRGGSGELQR